MGQRVVWNSVLCFLALVALFFLGAFGVLWLLPVGAVLDISLWGQILLPAVCFLLHTYIGFFAGECCLFYSSLFNVLLWSGWLFFLVWFLPVLLNRYTVVLPLLVFAALGFLGSMLGRSLAGVVAAHEPPGE